MSNLNAKKFNFPLQESRFLFNVDTSYRCNDNFFVNNNPKATIYKQWKYYSVLFL